MEFSQILANKFVRITLMIFFFLFIYKILFAIGIFFAIDSVVLSMYLCWIGMLILFAALLQIKNTNFNVKSPPPLTVSVFTKGVSSALEQASEVAKQVSTPKVGNEIQKGGSDEIVHV